MVGSKYVCIYIYLICLCIATVFIVWAARASNMCGDECWKLKSLFSSCLRGVCSLLAPVASEVRS